MLSVSTGFLSARLGRTRVRRAYVDTSGAWVEVPLADTARPQTVATRSLSRYSRTVTLAWRS